MTIAKINGIDIYYEEHGDAQAEPLLLIMGFITNCGAWAGQIPALAPHYRVVAFDNRGCGRSDSPEGPYTIAQMADDAAALLDHLGIAQAHIAGVRAAACVEDADADADVHGLRRPARNRLG
jgi:pimeloyl-ACP methyl ester carboxylesterase